jgi:hypothetical protein
MRLRNVFCPLFLLCGCSGNSTEEACGTPQQLSTSTGALKTETPLGVRTVQVGAPTEVTIDIEPLSYCEIVDNASTGSPSSDESTYLVSDANGFLSFDYVCQSNTPDTLHLKCTDRRGDDHAYSVEIAPTTESVPGIRQPRRPIAGSFVRPALTGDLMQPTQEELRRHHYPRRPDPVRSKKRFELWTSIVTRPFTVVPQDSVPIPRHASPQSATIWGGYVVESPRGSYNQAYGEWNVPRVSLPSSITQLSRSTSALFWVGLDGWNGSDVVQAGIGFDLSPTSSGGYTVSRYPWTETYPNVLHVLPNLQVHTHDLLYVNVIANCDSNGQVCVANPDPNYRHGLFDIMNVTAGTEGTTVVGYNSKANFLGNTAEWIVEGLKTQPLPTFEDTTISSASMCESAICGPFPSGEWNGLEAFEDARVVDKITMVSSATGAVRATATTPASGRVTLHWVAP